LTHSRLKERRHFLAFAVSLPLSLLGCGNSGDGTNVEIGDATKAEAKSRAEMYKARALEKKKGGPKR
jgi:hypothetical protein